MTYGLSLAFIGASLRARSMAAFARGPSLSPSALWVFGSTTYHVLVLGVPKAELTGAI